jgi:hypothetical protein
MRTGTGIKTLNRTTEEEISAVTTEEEEISRREGKRSMSATAYRSNYPTKRAVPLNRTSTPHFYFPFYRN